MVYGRSIKLTCRLDAQVAVRLVTRSGAPIGQSQLNLFLGSPMAERMKSAGRADRCIYMQREREASQFVTHPVFVT